MDLVSVLISYEELPPKIYSEDSNIISNKLKLRKDFLGGTVVKNLPAKAGDTGSSSGPGRSHMPRSN